MQRRAGGLCKVHRISTAAGEIARPCAEDLAHFKLRGVVECGLPTAYYGGVVRIEPEPVIIASTVVLRPWRAEDITALTAIYGDPLSVQYIDVPQPYDAARAAKFVRRAAGSRAAGTAFHYAVTLPDSDTVVGSAYLHDLVPAEAASDVSYLIHPRHRGRGWAAAALVTLSDAALRAGFRHIYARIKPGNRASEAVAARAGFSRLRADHGEVCWHTTYRATTDPYDGDVIPTHL